ncbi:hypothetical protein E1A91_A05G233300v1, partial [Gossypium mustelinum]
MWTDLLLQAAIILVTIFMFLAMHDIPKKIFTKIRYRNRADFQAKRHFVLGAQLLAQARSSKSRSSTASLAKQAEAEADKAISLDRKDAAAYILKALALDLQGFKTSALDSLDVALSPIAAKSLTDKERGDALFKRAELKMSMNRRGGRVDSAIDDLTKALELIGDNAKAFCLLGECYEMKKMKSEAKSAFEKALKVEPTSIVACTAIDRLGSTCFHGLHNYLEEHTEVNLANNSVKRQGLVVRSVRDGFTALAIRFLHFLVAKWLKLRYLPALFPAPQTMSMLFWVVFTRLISSMP